MGVCCDWATCTDLKRCFLETLCGKEPEFRWEQMRIGPDLLSPAPGVYVVNHAHRVSRMLIRQISQITRCTGCLTQKIKRRHMTSIVVSLFTVDDD